MLRKNTTKTKKEKTFKMRVPSLKKALIKIKFKEKRRNQRYFALKARIFTIQNFFFSIF